MSCSRPVSFYLYMVVTLKFFIILTLILFTSTSHAELTGFWSGWGFWTFQGSGTRCYDVRFLFRENTQGLNRVAARFECDFVSLSMDPIRIVKDSGKLLNGSEVIGTYDDSTYKWVEHYTENIDIHVVIERSGLHADYSEEWIDKGSSLYKIKARLFKGDTLWNKETSLKL